MKRPAAEGAEGEPTPARRKSVGVPAKQWKSVAKAVGKAEGIPEDAAACLERMVGQALGVFKSDRHPFQETIVGHIGEVLAGTEKALEAKSADATAAAAGVDSEKGKRDQAVVDAKASEASLSAAKTSAGTAVEAAEKEISDAEAAIVDAIAKEKENEASAKKMAKERVVLEENRMLLTGPSPVKKKSVKKLVALGKTIGLEASLLGSVELSLGKTLEGRGDFDKIIVSNAEAKFAEQSEGLGTKIMAALAAKEPCAKAVVDAKAALAAAKEKLKAAEAALEAAEAALVAGKAAVKAAEKSAKRVYPDIKALLDAMDDAKAALQTFRAGPLATYSELKTAEAPPPPEPEAVEPAAAPETAPVA